jgi:hypothetical protein
MSVNYWGHVTEEIQIMQGGILIMDMKFQPSKIQEIVYVTNVTSKRPLALSVGSIVSMTSKLGANRSQIVTGS